MTNLGLLDYYLGVEVKQGLNGLVLRQVSYAKRILEKIGMKGCNPCKIPMETKTRLIKENTLP
jgi:hypothetical protein